MPNPGAKRTRPRHTLKSARLAAGLSVKEIADRLGVSESLYYKIEEGVRDPKLWLAGELARLLGRNIHDLLFDEEAPPPAKAVNQGD